MSRKSIAYSFAALSLLLSTGGYAQSLNQATVPFAFTAGNLELPAGEYLIEQKSENNFISIADVKSGRIVFAFASEKDILPPNAPAKLIFHCYGNQHFLAAVWTGGGGTARLFSATPQEKEFRAHLVASNPTDHDTRDVAAIK